MDCGLFSERNIQHYVERAKGGAAAVTVSQNVDPYSMMSDEYPVGSDPRNKENFRRLAAEVHKYGCKCITQLNHGGHNTLKNPPQILVAPSQMPEPSCHFNTKELEKEELEQIKDYYVKAATLQQGVGWDAVELKIAHDGLLRTFISPLFNKREDEYGGSFENRMRYPLEIIEAIREAVGPDYPIGIRLCVDEFIEGGYSMEYGLKVAKRLEEAGVDYLSTDAGSFSSFYMEIPPAVIPLGFALYMSAELKKTVDIPVIAAGGIADGRQLLAAYALGAIGAQVGTCLLVSEECPIHENYKKAVLKAKDRDTVVTGRSVDAPVRILRNQMSREYLAREKAGADRMELEHYTLGSLRRAVFDGDTKTGSLMAGQVAGMLHEIKPLRQIFEELNSGCAKRLAELEL